MPELAIKGRDLEERDGSGDDDLSGSAQKFGRPLMEFIQRRSRTWIVVVSFLLLALIGYADYRSGFERSLLIFYMVPIALGTWFISWRFGGVLAVVSVAVWIWGDIAAGAVYSSPDVLLWNAGIAIAFFFVLVWLLHQLHSLLTALEARVQQRTAALREEMEVRMRLERDVTEAGERERRRIGHDLHDGLGQHLTGTSLALQVLRGKLADEGSSYLKDVDKTVDLIEEAIELTRSTAKGVFPLELEAQGLSGALLELCHNTREHHPIHCELDSDETIELSDGKRATHLYRIAQEAVLNSIKHGHVSRIAITLSQSDAKIRLTVRDDGIGLSPSLSEERGIGLRVMKSRAGMIGAMFSVANNPEGGTTVTCELPHPGTSQPMARTHEDAHDESKES